MSRIIKDLNIEAGYPYEFNLDMNDALGVDLEGDYACYFECASVGRLQFSVVNNAYILTISKENTDKLLTNLEEYTVHTIKTVGGAYDKILQGRIHINDKVRA